MALGIVFNSVLPSVFGSMQQQLGALQGKLEKMAFENQQRILGGQEADDRAVKDMGRILRVSKFLSTPERQWQLCVTLTSVSIVDKLRWRILGARGRQTKAGLMEMVDSRQSIVGEALEKLLQLLDMWSEVGVWGLLKQFGLQDWSAEGPRRFARNSLLRTAAGLFYRTEKRFNSWPYKLYWLVADSIPLVVKGAVAQELLEAPPCCLGAFGSCFRKKFPSLDQVLSPAAETVLLAWWGELRFSTAPVECEHIMVKDEVASTTSGAAHSPIACRALVRHVHQAHKHRGGADMSLPLRRRTPIESAATHGRCWPDTAPKPALIDDPPTSGDQVVATQLSASAAPELGELHLVERINLGGGNPKVAFLNFELQKARAARAGNAFGRAEVQALRQELVRRYDASEQLQRRWKVIFDAVRKHKAQKAAKLGDTTAPIHSDCSDLWPGHMQPGPGDGEQSRLPIAEGRLATWRAETCGTSTDFEERAQDSADFEILVPRDGQALGRTPFPVFGCAAEPHNACRATLSKQGKLARFERLQAAWMKWFRAIAKAEAPSGDVLVSVRPTECQDKSIWLLMTDAIFSPVVQTFVVCCPTGVALDMDGFCMEPDKQVPFDIEIRSSASRLNHFGIGSMKTVWHITSDELLARLSSHAGLSWEVARARYAIRSDSPSLRFMTVTELLPAFNLRDVAKRQLAKEDPFFDWLRLSAPRSSTRLARRPGSDANDPTSVEAAEAGAIGDATAVGAPLSEWADEEHEASEEAADDLEDLLVDLLEEAEQEEGDDSEALGCAEPDDPPPKRRRTTLWPHKPPVGKKNQRRWGRSQR